MRIALGIVENPRDEEPGKDKEQIYACPTEPRNPVNRSKQETMRLGASFSDVMKQKHNQYCEAA